MRVWELLARSADRHADGEAVFDGDRRRTFAELRDRAGRLAAGLGDLGLQRGDRAAVVARNRVEFVELYFALARLGAVTVPINWRLRPSEIAYQLDDAQAAVAIVEGPFAQALEPGLRALPSLRASVLLGGDRSGWLGYEGLIAERPLPAGDGVVAGDDFVQMYTSGTTGRPRGALLTHANVCSLVSSWSREIRLGAVPDRFLQVTPLFHVGGMLQVLSAAAAGATLRLLPEFLPGAALDALERERVTHALFVPSMVRWMLSEEGVGRRSFPALRILVYGAAPFPVPTLVEAMGVFRCGFLQGYGLTETAGVLTVLRPEDHAFAPGETPRRLASAGRAIEGCEVRVVDERGVAVPPGEVGEIVARGAQVGPGYWRCEDATREAFRDGWFHTGDLATIDEQGYIYVVDRLKDMILVAGENVYPREVEDVLLAHPAVRDAAVIGIPHAHWGEEVLALVVLAQEAGCGDRELIQHCRARLARFKCPTRVESVRELPRNAAGKVLKRDLREPYWRGRERRV